MTQQRILIKLRSASASIHVLAANGVSIKRKVLVMRVFLALFKISYIEVAAWKNAQKELTKLAVLQLLFLDYTALALMSAYPLMFFLTLKMKQSA